MGQSGNPGSQSEDRDYAHGVEHGHEHGHDHSHGHQPGRGHDHEHASAAQPDPRDVELEEFVARVAVEIGHVDPRLIAARTGAEYDPDDGDLSLRVYGKLFAAKFPSLEAHELAADHHLAALWLRVLLAHYFRTADGTPLTGRWASLRDLPGGLMYERAFQGYSGDELARGFGSDFSRLRELATRYGARPMSQGDASFWLDVLPRVPIAVVCYQGDDELPSTAQLLFDAAANHYLPTDALATLGGRLARLLLQAEGVETGRVPITPGWLGRLR